MAILVKRNIRIPGTKELIGPVLAVEKLELVAFSHGGRLTEREFFHLEDGSLRRESELIFVEMDEDLLTAMRVEARILAKDKKR